MLFSVANTKKQISIINEKLEKLGTNAFITSNPTDLINLMKNKPNQYRIVYDNNINLYMICKADECIHYDMLNQAYRSGLYYNMEEFIESLGAFQNYIETGISGGWDADDNEIESYLYYMVFDPKNDWELGDDGYDTIYELPFGNLFSRECNIKEISLYNVLPLNEQKENISESNETNLNQNFWKWFGNSKCVDSKGNPKIFIHRSDAKFDTFDKNKIGQRDSGWYGKGFYFGSAKQKDYTLYGKNIYKCYLKMENPYYYPISLYDTFGYCKLYDDLGITTSNESEFIKSYDNLVKTFNNSVSIEKKEEQVKYNGNVYTGTKFILSALNKTFETDPMAQMDEETAKIQFFNDLFAKYNDNLDNIKRALYKRSDKFSEAIRKQGYDGIIKDDEYIVFEPNQIKSIKNNGNWSLESDNINESKNKIIVYHGSSSKKLKIKNNSNIFFTTNKEDAIQWANRTILGNKKNKNNYIHTAELTFNKPYVVGDSKVNPLYKKYKDNAEKNDIYTEIFFEDINENRSILVDRGYDCFIFNISNSIFCD